MPWQINHRCNISQPDRDFDILKTVRNGRDVTLALCPNPACREEIVMDGHDLFQEAVHADRVGDNLPPGFWLPRGPRAQ